jgi:hypothetical protein
LPNPYSISIIGSDLLSERSTNYGWRTHSGRQDSHKSWIEELEISSANIINLGLSQIRYTVPMLKFRRAENLLGVITKYEISGIYIKNSKSGLNK